MMRQALVALGPKTVLAGVLVGGAALALGALFVPPPSVTAHATMYRLVLHAPEQEGAFYLSAWGDGEQVFVADGDAKRLTFVRRGDEHDGCAWQGTERLVRIAPSTYAYDYAETILSCRPDAHPFIKTPRQGFVTVEKWQGPATATAQFAVVAPGDAWQPEDMPDDECNGEHAEADDDVVDQADDADDNAQVIVTVSDEE